MTQTEKRPEAERQRDRKAGLSEEYINHGNDADIGQAIETRRRGINKEKSPSASAPIHSDFIYSPTPSHKKKGKKDKCNETRN